MLHFFLMGQLIRINLCLIFFFSLNATFFTLKSGGWADNERLLEGFCLATKPSRARWNGDTLLS